ncbi:MAG: amino acid ABC transporter substrate-binding protein [Desulfobacterium sp.]|nr:amino acid ABC transporter substrate-binding protein [Desulfobacterium sp.]
MLKRNLIWLVAAAALIVAGTTPAFAGKKIVNGIDANFPPFAYIDKTGKPAGFDVEAMEWIAKDLGLEVEHKAIDWDGIITSLMTKKIDVIASGMSITPDRAKKVNFTIPYWKIDQVMVVKKDSALTMDGLMKGEKKIGVQQGTSEAKWLKSESEPRGWNFKLSYYSSSPLAVEDVLNGRIAAAAMDDAPAHDAVSKKDVKILGNFGMHAEDFGYAVRKGETELLEKINKSLEKLMASPHWDELAVKYKLK